MSQWGSLFQLVATCRNDARESSRPSLRSLMRTKNGFACLTRLAKPCASWHFLGLALLDSRKYYCTYISSLPIP